MKKSILSLMLLAAGATSASAYANSMDTTFSGRQSGFTGTISQSLNASGALTSGVRLTVGPVVQTENEVSSLGQGAYTLPSTASLMPNFNWRQDLNGDGYYSQQEVLEAAQTFVNNNRTTVLNNIADTLRGYGLQSGWFTWSHQVNVDNVVVTQNGGAPSSTSSGTSQRTLFWSAIVITGQSTPDFEFGEVKLLEADPVILQMEVYPQEFDDSLTYFRGQLNGFNWGEAQAGHIPDVSGGQAGSMRWRAVRLRDGQQVSPTNGQQWNSAVTGAQFDRQLSGSLDPVQCVVSKTNPGCSGITAPSYEELSQATGAAGGLIYYQERVRPRYSVVNGASVPTIEFDFNQRAINHGHICDPGTFTTGGCFYADLQYETGVYSIDINTSSATLIGKDAAEVPTNPSGLSGCVKGQPFTPVTGPVTAEQSSFPWYLRHYYPRNPGGPYDDWTHALREVAPRANRSDFPLEHLSQGDGQVLQNIVNDDPVVLGSSQYKGADSLGANTLFGTNPDPAYNIPIPSAACVECVPTIEQFIREWCGNSCRNIWETEACPAQIPMCVSASQSCTTQGGITSCVTVCDVEQPVTPCWEHGWTTNSCNLRGEPTPSCSTTTNTGRDPATCPGGMVGFAFYPWTQQITTCTGQTFSSAPQNGQYIGEKVVGALDASNCAAAVECDCNSGTVTGSDPVECRDENGFVFKEGVLNWTAEQNTCVCKQYGTDNFGCPAGQMGNSYQDWVRDVYSDSMGAKSYNTTREQFCSTCTGPNCGPAPTCANPTNSAESGVDQFTCSDGRVIDRPWTRSAQCCSTTTDTSTDVTCPDGSVVTVPGSELTTTCEYGERQYADRGTPNCVPASVAPPTPTPTPTPTPILINNQIINRFEFGVDAEEPLYQGRPQSDSIAQVILTNTSEFNRVRNRLASITIELFDSRLYGIEYTLSSVEITTTDRAARAEGLSVTGFPQTFTANSNITSYPIELSWTPSGITNPEIDLLTRSGGGLISINAIYTTLDNRVDPTKKSITFERNFYKVYTYESIGQPCSETFEVYCQYSEGPSQNPSNLYCNRFIKDDRNLYAERTKEIPPAIDFSIDQSELEKAFDFSRRGEVIQINQLRNPQHPGEQLACFSRAGRIYRDYTENKGLLYDASTWNVSSGVRTDGYLLLDCQKSYTAESCSPIIEPTCEGNVTPTWEVNGNICGEPNYQGRTFGPGQVPGQDPYREGTSKTITSSINSNRGTATFVCMHRAWELDSNAAAPTCSPPPAPSSACRAGQVSWSKNGVSCTGNIGEGAIGGRTGVSANPMTIRRADGTFANTQGNAGFMCSSSPGNGWRWTLSDVPSFPATCRLVDRP